MADTPDFLERFRSAGAVLTGHFLLSSGLHSDTYVQCARVLESPGLAEDLCRRLAAEWGNRPSVVAGPAFGGILVAHELARAFGSRSVFFERVGPQFELRRGFQIGAGESVLVAEDVVTTGGSAQEVVARVEALKGAVMGVTALVDRGGGGGLGREFRALVRLEARSWKAEECPLCRSGSSPVRPGSRPAKEG